MSTLKVDTITDSSSGLTTTINGVTPTTNNVKGRNLIINGAMQVAQRNTSVSGVVNSGYVSLDRYQIDYSGAGTWTISQDSDAPNGFGNSMKFLCTASDSLDQGADRLAFRQFIEGQNLQQLKKGTADAQQSTVSFWVKSNKTGTYIVEIYDHDNARHINKAYTVSSANTWEYKTVTFEADTTGALDNDNALSLHLHFWLAAGSTYSGGALQTSWGGNATTNRAAGNVNLADTVNNYFNITGIQLEVGSVATEFDHRSFGEELLLCQRYYEHTYPYGTAPGSANGGIGADHRYVGRSTPNGYGYFTGHYRVEKRAAATVTVYSYGGTANQMSNGDSGADIGAVDVIQNGATSFLPRNQSGSTIAEMAVMYHFKADAEL